MEDELDYLLSCSMKIDHDHTSSGLDVVDTAGILDDFTNISDSLSLFLAP